MTDKIPNFRLKSHAFQTDRLSDIERHLMESGAGLKTNSLIILLVLYCEMLSFPALAQNTHLEILKKPILEGLHYVYSSAADVLDYIEPVLDAAEFAESRQEEYVKACILVLHAHLEIDDFMESPKNLPTCHKLATTLPSLELRADFYAAWVGLEIKQKNLQKAEELLALAEQTADPLPRNGVWISILHSKADLAYARRDNGKTVDLLKEAYRLAAGSEDIRYNLLKHRLARAYYVLEDYDRARELYLASYEFASNPPMSFMLNFVTYNLALLLKDKEPDLAARFYEESIVNSNLSRQPSGIAYGLLGKARIKARMGDYKDVEPWLRKAEKIFLETRNYVMQAQTLFELALVHKHFKRPYETIRYMEHALKIFIEVDFGSYVASTAKSLAEQHQAVGNIAQAYATQEIYISYQEKLLIKKYNEDLARQKTQLDLEMEEQKNVRLRQENELQSIKIRKVEQERIVLWSLAIVGLIAVVSLGVNAARAREIKQARRKLQGILDQIEEGIVTFGGDFKIESPHSPYLEKIFQADSKVIANSNILDLLVEFGSISADQQDLLRTSLSSVFGEDPIAWDLNNDHFPRDMQIKIGDQEKFLSLHWQPIFSSGPRSFLSKVLLSIRDETETRFLELQVKEARAKQSVIAERIMEILAIPRLELTVFFKNLELKINALEAQLAAPRVDSKAVFHNLHTVKGASRTLKLHRISELVHSMEGHLNHGDMPVVDVQSLGQRLEELKTLSLEYQELISKFPSEVAKGALEQRGLLQVAGKYALLAHRSLQEHKLSLAGFAIDDCVVVWPKGMLEKIDEILIHVTNNSIDHGFVIPASKGRKPAAAHFHLMAQQIHGNIKLEFRDNGAGLDKEKLQELARKRGFVPQRSETLWDVVFMDGVSTTDKVTASSGRGVGMSAIRAICESLRGTAHILPNDQGLGSLVVINLPSPS